ncbi:TIGR01459 family HAD-type hydrolase [Bosea caraganae]|uniref:TIGR01459 family HAD-type hydrolase n=1 Tax=Bosea caraganae TaxID=2763117 RepID=UPI003CCC8944
MRPLQPEQPLTQALTGFSEIAGKFDLCLCDIWGVVHNGVAAHREAVEALAAMRRQGMAVVLVTNAPRPRQAILTQLAQLAVPDEAFDAVVTSGDVCRALIEQRSGEPMYMLGPDRDLPLIAGLDAPRVASAQARYVLCTGFFDDERETVDTYAELLDDFARRGLILICANPDLVVDRGGKIVPCAGSLALAYEQLGGQVIYAGKPHRPIYEMALELAQVKRGGPIARERVCAIGDAIRTDIAGANAFNATSVMVLAGIHAQDLVAQSWAERHDWFSRQTHRPDYAIPHLVW